MVRWRQVVKDGNSLAIRLFKADKKDFDIELGDEADIEHLVIKGKIKKN